MVINANGTKVELRGKKVYINGSKVTENGIKPPKFGFLSGFVIGLSIATIIHVLF